MNIAILGSGVFGLAIASIFYDNKCNIKLWSNNDSEVNTLNNTRRKDSINYNIPNSFIISTNLESTIKDSDIIVIAVPSIAVKDVTIKLKKYYKKNQTIIITSKGLDIDSNILYNTISKNLNTNNIAIMAGGTFAIDIINKVPVGFTIASKKKSIYTKINNIIKSNYVNLEYTSDIIGVSLLGTIKNIFAIASGIINENYPVSTSSMLLKEFIIESKLLIKKFGGKEKTIFTYAGISDIYLTCNSDKSRNYTLGKLIGNNTSKEEINTYINNNLIEGITSLKLLNNLVKNSIVNVIYDIVFNNRDKEDLIKYIIKK